MNTIDWLHIPMMDRREDSLSDQLDDLIGVANRLGMVDAAEYLKYHIVKHVFDLDSNKN